MNLRPLIQSIKIYFNRYRVFLTYSGLLYLTAMNFVLRNDVVDLKVQLAELKAENQKLIADMVYFNRSFEDFPLPVWQKVKRKDKFVMQYVNGAYYEQYLKPNNLSRFDYMGNTDFDIYDYSTALQYYARDLQIALDGGHKRFDEFITVKKKINKLDVIKWRVIERRDTLIYGMIIPEKLKI